MDKFSDELIYAAIDFSRRVREEIGDELGEERVSAMFDAFDPALKGLVFMKLLTGEIGMVRVGRGSGYDIKKINAIKALRRLTGWGLKESKEFFDDLNPGGTKLLEGQYKLDQIREFREGLFETGYHVT